MLRKSQRNFFIKRKKNNLRQDSCFILPLILLCTMWICLISCAVEKGKVYEKDGKLYGKHDGLFKGKWYNYYLRGLSYNEGGFWEDAAADFMEATKKRDKDQRRSRTYGVHFIDYFPNRELGIASFNLGNFKEAIQFLEASLESVESARAKFYLNRARKSWLNETGLDAIGPAISVEFPPPVYRTNDFVISVQGTAQDDFFISNIILNGKSSKLDLSKRRVSFKKEIPLDHGRNFITLQSEDILGKISTPVTIKVEVDREGPLVFLQAENKEGNTVEITGAVYDKSAISKITINNKELIFEEAQLLSINEQLTALKPTTADSIRFEAEDILGNRTAGHIQLPDSKKSIKIPAINLKGLRDGQAMFLDALAVEGTVWSNEGIQDLIINRQSLLSLEEYPAGVSFLKIIKEKKNTPLTFSKIIELKEGRNTITTTLVEMNGKGTETPITITRKIPKVKQLASRMSLAIFPFRETKKIEEGLSNYVYTFLTNAFEDQKRFNVLGRTKLKSMLKQQELNGETIFDQETAKRLSHLMESEAFLVGDINTFNQSIEILASLVDTETSTILAENDVYWENGLNSGSKETLDEMALKFKQHLPLCEGTIMSEKSSTVIFNLGESQSVHPGMRFLAFRESVPIFDTVTGMNLGRDTDILGLLYAKEIDKTFSKADVLKEFTTKDIQVGDKVISK